MIEAPEAAAVLINKDAIAQLDQILQNASAARPSTTNLQDLAVEVNWSRQRTVWVVYGAGEIQAIEEIIQRISACSVVALVQASGQDDYELTAKQRKRITGWLNKERLFIIAGGSVEQRARKIAGLIDIDTMDGWKPILSKQTLKDHGQDVGEFLRVLASCINTKTMHKSTRLLMSGKFLRNALINAPLAYRPTPLDVYRNALHQRPALVVSAGPSLNKQLPLLAENQDLFTILAVDTVWPILHKHGIRPDFLVALDPKTSPSWPANGLDEQTHFMVDVGCSPKMVWSHNRNHVFTSCHSQVNACLADFGGLADHLSTGGSVATTAFNLAELAGANPIILIGQDLALTGGRDHADGYLYKYDEAHLKARTNAGYDVEGYYGDRVRTERQLLLYKNWFEDRIKTLSPDRMVINATEGGARIAGALQIPFAQVCAEIRSTSMRKNPPMPSGHTAVDMAHMARLSANLAQMIEKVQAFQQLGRDGLQCAEQSPRRASQKQLSAIDDINLAIKEFDPSAKLLVDVFGMLELEAVRYSTVIKKDLKGLTDAVAKYRAVYQHLVESADRALAMLQKISRLYAQVQQHQSFDPAFMKEALGETP